MYYFCLSPPSLARSFPTRKLKVRGERFNQSEQKSAQLKTFQTIYLAPWWHAFHSTKNKSFDKWLFRYLCFEPTIDWMHYAFDCLRSAESSAHTIDIQLSAPAERPPLSRVQRGRCQYFRMDIGVCCRAQRWINLVLWFELEHLISEHQTGRARTRNSICVRIWLNDWEINSTKMLHIN